MIRGKKGKRCIEGQIEKLMVEIKFQNITTIKANGVYSPMER